MFLACAERSCRILLDSRSCWEGRPGLGRVQKEDYEPEAIFLEAVNGCRALRLGWNPRAQSSLECAIMLKAREVRQEGGQRPVFSNFSRNTDVVYFDRYRYCVLIIQVSSY